MFCETTRLSGIGVAAGVMLAVLIGSGAMEAGPLRAAEPTVTVYKTPT